MLVIKRLIKRKVLLLGLLVVMFAAKAQNSAYIANHKVVATLLGEHYGIPAPVILAVAAIESSGGAGPAAKVLNNHFGIEGENKFVNRKGHKSRYKQYSNEWASYVDFCQIISRKSFYKHLKGNDDCRAWVKAISNCGYSEQPEQWEKKVFSVLNSSNNRPELSGTLALR
jgi:Bax protein